MIEKQESEDEEEEPEEAVGFFDAESFEFDHADGKMMVNENEEDIDIGWECYKKFFMNYYGGLKFFFFSQFTMIMFLSGLISGDYLIGVWVESTNEQARYPFFASLSFGLCLFTTIAVTCRVYAFLY